MSKTITTRPDEPQHCPHFVANTRWWPPFCMTVDFVVAMIIAIEIAAGLHFR